MAILIDNNHITCPNCNSSIFYKKDIFRIKKDGKIENYGEKIFCAKCQKELKINIKNI